MRMEQIENDGDELAEWVFGIARMFGTWPFTNQISKITRLTSPKLTVSDCLWLTIVFGVHLASLCCHLYSQQVTSYYESAIEARISSWGSMFYISSAIMNMIFSILNRNNLLRLLSINQDIEQKVSVDLKH